MKIQDSKEFWLCETLILNECIVRFVLDNQLKYNRLCLGFIAHQLTNPNFIANIPCNIPIPHLAQDLILP